MHQNWIDADACDILQVLISRNYRGDIEPSVIDKFMPLLMDREEEGNMSPIIQVINSSECGEWRILHNIPSISINFMTLQCSTKRRVSRVRTTPGSY